MPLRHILVAVAQPIQRPTPVSQKNCRSSNLLVVLPSSMFSSHLTEQTYFTEQHRSPAQAPNSCRASWNAAGFDALLAAAQWVQLDGPAQALSRVRASKRQTGIP